MSSQLHGEITHNFERFAAQWPQDLVATQTALQSKKKDFEQSYIRITSIQAWRTSVLINKLPEDAEAFFFEAQNDFLISHCLANCGSFRQALKSIRAAIENIYFALYYMDHPIELRKWGAGKHKLGFSELHNYLEHHPEINGQTMAITALGSIKDEYSTLSKAVHGSAKPFRMTQNLTEIRLWGDDAASVGRWATREKFVLHAINTILIHIFKDDLVGSKNRNLRETIGLVLPKSQHKEIKTQLGITLISE